MLGSPITIRRRRTRKAEMRVASVEEGADQMETAVRARSRSAFLKERTYGRRGRREDSVSLRVEVSDRFSRRWWSEAVCDLRRGVRVRYFLVSEGRRLDTGNQSSVSSYETSGLTSFPLLSP